MKRIFQEKSHYKPVHLIIRWQPHRRKHSVIPPTATDVSGAWSVFTSVTLVHPAKAAGQKEMPFVRDTRVDPINIVLDMGPGSPTARGDLGVGTPSQSLHYKLRPNRYRWHNGYYS